MIFWRLNDIDIDNTKMSYLFVKLNLKYIFDH